MNKWVISLLLTLFSTGAFSQSIFSDGFEGPSPVIGCEAGGPLIAPPGYEKITRNWGVVWSSPLCPNCQVYPDSGALSNLPFPRIDKDQVVAIPFTALPDLTIRINWTTPVQPNGGIGYPRARVATAIFISISPCKWDVRPPTSSTDPDQFLRGGCRKFSSGTIITYTTKPIQVESTGSVCRIQSGQTYYLNMIMADPSDGLDEEENTCVDPTIVGCEVQGSHKPIG